MYLYCNNLINPKTLNVTTTAAYNKAATQYAVQSDEPHYKTMLPNIYYCPSFTSNEISDKDFERRAKIVYDKINDIMVPGITNTIPQLTKENIVFAEKLIHKYPNQNILYRLDSLNYVNKDNEHIAELLYLKPLTFATDIILCRTNKDNIKAIEKICRLEANPFFKTALTENLTKENAALANYILENKPAKDNIVLHLPEILKEFNADELHSFCILASYVDNLDDEFIAGALEMLNKKPNRADLKFIKDLHNDTHFNNYLKVISSGNIDLAKEMLSYNEKASDFGKNKFKIKYEFDDYTKNFFTYDLLMRTNKDNLEFVKTLLKENSSGEDIKHWADLSFTPGTAKAVEKLYRTPVVDIKSAQLMTGNLSPAGLNYLADHNPEKHIKEFDKLQDIVYAHPEKYITGIFETVEEVQETLDQFFSTELDNNERLILACCLLDKEAIETLLRKRLDNVPEYLYIINSLDGNELDMVADFNDAVNIHGKPFLPKQKLEFLDLIDSYKENEVDMSKMKTMLKSGKVNLAELNMDLFEKIMKTLGYTQEQISQIPEEKLGLLDADYTNLLAKQLKNPEGKENFKTILDLSFFNDNFKSVIHDDDTTFGQANISTCEEFIRNGFDYENWLNPSEDLNVHLIAEDKNVQQLNQIASRLTENIEELRKSNAKEFINKQLAPYIKNNKFTIPKEYLTNKTLLATFVTNIIKQLDSVWQRAKSNINNSEKSTAARHTLTLLDHLNQIIKDINTTDETKGHKKLDVTIKMWDRIPQKDLFQGNYSTCCIGLGNENSETMPVYLMHTAFNMIEIVDNETGKIIGNALCYFVKKNSSDKTAFVIDNIEINNSLKPSKETGIKLRNAIKQYAKNIVKEVTGNNKMPIYLGKSFNDIPDKDLPFNKENISLLGDLSPDTDIYLDVFKGWIISGSPTSGTYELAYLN